VLTAAEQALDPPLPGTVAPPPPCRVDREVADGDVLDLAGGAVVVHVPGHTPGSIVLHLPRLDVLLTGDVVAEVRGSIITGVFDTDRARLECSIDRLAATGVGIAGPGHGEAVLTDAAARIAARSDPFG
jgi:glyoxylase-like metal-dependent hydrolase (beta-lactamase superfamily II)